MNTVSLLYPNETPQCYQISRTIADDLGIPFLAEHITETSTERKVISDVLLKMPVSEEIIRYRQAVYSELRGDEALCTELFKVCDSLRFSFNDRPVQIGEQSTIWELIQRFRSLEHYIRSVLKLCELFDGRTFQSEGMRRVAEYVLALGKDSGFDALLEDISVLDDNVYSIHSITIGVNLTPDYYPAEAGIVSLNKHFFGEQSALQRFMAFHRKDQVSDKDLYPFSMEKHDDGWDWFEKHFYGIQTPKRPVDSLLMNNLTSIIERMSGRGV